VVQLDGPAYWPTGKTPAGKLDWRAEPICWLANRTVVQQLNEVNLVRQLEMGSAEFAGSVNSEFTTELMSSLNLLQNTQLYIRADHVV
jgi:hypothetical protein